MVHGLWTMVIFIAVVGRQLTVDFLFGTTSHGPWSVVIFIAVVCRRSTMDYLFGTTSHGPWSMDYGHIYCRGLSTVDRRLTLYFSSL